MNKRELRAAQEAASRAQMLAGSCDGSRSSRTELVLALSTYHEHMTNFHQQMWLSLRQMATQISITGKEVEDSGSEAGS